VVVPGAVAMPVVMVVRVVVVVVVVEAVADPEDMAVGVPHMHLAHAPPLDPAQLAEPGEALLEAPDVENRRQSVCLHPARVREAQPTCSATTPITRPGRAEPPAGGRRRPSGSGRRADRRWPPCGGARCCP